MLVVACVLWVPRSGRFVSSGTTGAAPLRRDDWNQSIAWRSCLYGFIVLMLAIGAVAVYSGSALRADVPVVVVSLVGVLGKGVYIGSNLSLRQAFPAASLKTVPGNAFPSHGKAREMLCAVGA